MYFFAEAMTSSACWYCDGPVGFRARSRLAPAATPTSSVTMAATRNRARLRRRAARTAKAVARTSAGPLEGSEGAVSAARNLVARPASSAAARSVAPSASCRECSPSPGRARRRRRWVLPRTTGLSAPPRAAPPRAAPPRAAPPRAAPPRAAPPREVLACRERRRLAVAPPVPAVPVAGWPGPRARSRASASARWSWLGGSGVIETPGRGAPRGRASVACALRPLACPRLRRPPGPTARSTPVAKGLPGRTSGAGQRSGAARPGPR
jgi:hypothetical protein